MNNYRIIDAHTHIYPTAIAAKATGAISGFYDVPMRHCGTAEELIASGKKINTEKYLVCSAATAPQQVVSINNFIISECEKHSEFVGFGTLHPEFENCGGELERIKKAGLKGVKLHPDFQKFYIDDPAAFSMFKEIAQSKMVLLIHTGDKEKPYSQPHRMAELLEKLPELRAIAAHFGGYQAWDEAYEAYKIGSCMFDISSALQFMDRKQVYSFFDKFGVESFFFGTDFPMEDHENYLKMFLELGLSEEQNRMILSENFERFLNNKCKKPCAHF